MSSSKWMSAASLVIVASFLLAYFARPRAPQFELVTPQQESATYHARYPSDSNLANRVVKSYDLAFILVQGPYLSTNVEALEAVREWARDQFQAHPDFLHPVSLPAGTNLHDTVFGAFGSTIFAAPCTWCESLVASVLRSRIANFHKSSAFRSFNKAFFDVFGDDTESAILLSRYESERARQAIDIILWSFVWLAGTVAGGYALVSNRRRDFFRALRLVTAGAWGTLALAYTAQCWASGSASALISAVLAGALGFYFWHPVMLISHSEVKQQLVHVRLAPCWIAVGAWFTFTCFAVQLLTWLRAGTPAAPDPASLLLASFSGNFLHDPVQERHAVSTAIVWFWALVTTWTLFQRSKDQAYGEPDDSFETLDRIKTLERAG